MIKRVLIIGGYGNFGRYISTQLAQEKNLQLVIAGRNPSKGFKLLKTLNSVNQAEVVKLDIHHCFKQSLASTKPDIVIHTSGPFQKQSYAVASACIEQGVHYLDLADAREFVTGMSALDDQARQNKVLVVTGASSVPTLTCAIIDAYQERFESITSVDSAISTTQITAAGLATTQAILSYVGKTFSVMKNGKSVDVYGWQDLRMRKFWKLNTRALCNCNIPDFDVLPVRYPSLQNIRFQAGIELKFQQILLYLFSFFVRMRLLPNLTPFAKPMLQISKLFEFMSTGKSGYFLTLDGTTMDGSQQQLQFDLVARQKHGQYIPTIPSILLTKKLANNDINTVGAMPCVGLINLGEYLGAFDHLDIEWQTNTLQSLKK